MTIHKAQGNTLDYVSCDLGCREVSGLTYTVLSRVRSLENLRFCCPVLDSRLQAVNRAKSLKDIANFQLRMLGKVECIQTYTMSFDQRHSLGDRAAVLSFFE